MNDAVENPCRTLAVARFARAVGWKWIAMAGIVVATSALNAAPAAAQSDPFADVDIWVQQIEDKLVTGQADVDQLSGDALTVPQRLFHGALLSSSGGPAGSVYTNNNPGFFSLSQSSLDTLGKSSVVEPLPGVQPLSFDLLPFRINSVSSNLFYWDAIDDDNNGFDLSDVTFGVPTNAAFQLMNTVVVGTDQRIGGQTIATTSGGGSSGALHQHRGFIVSNQLSSAQFPAEGIYVMAAELQMPTLEASEPIVVAMRTPGVSSNADIAARTWLEDNFDSLFASTLAGDYNGDGLVNLADYTIWRDTLGSTTDLAANGDNTGASEGVIDGADYSVWKAGFVIGDNQQAVVSNLAVPEPAASAIILAVLPLALVLFASTRSGIIRGHEAQ